MAKKNKKTKPVRDEKNDTKIRIRKAHSKEITIRSKRLDLQKMDLVSLLAIVPFAKLKKLVDTHLRIKPKKRPPLKPHRIETGQ